MQFTIVGLGNKGDEYEKTRHNVGRMVLSYIQEKNDFSSWILNKKTKALESKGEIGKHKVTLVMPETFMNASGEAARHYVKSKKDLERLVVVYDELDLPIGKLKISYGRSSGGHRGLESLIKHMKSKDFTRIRIGISPQTPSGKLKKPHGEKEVIDFILGKFKPTEADILKKEMKKIAEAIELIVREGREKAMMEINS